MYRSSLSLLGATFDNKDANVAKVSKLTLHTMSGIVRQGIMMSKFNVGVILINFCCYRCNILCSYLTS